MALLRLTKTRVVRRLDRGLYDAPKQHQSSACCILRPEAILAAISRRDERVPGA